MIDKIRRAISDPMRAISLIRGLRKRQILTGYCTVCGNSTFFSKAGNNLRETYKCKICGSISRNRHLAKVLCHVFGISESCSLQKLRTSFPQLRLYEAQATGAIHDSLTELKGYVCSEFFPNIPCGVLSGSGIRCEDLQRLSFEDNSFDIVITQDVLEHVRNPELAWKEIHRVLKPLGYHIFTIPYSKDRTTVRRVELVGGNDAFVLPQVFHSDGVGDGLVYMDFGYDLLEHLDAVGFSTKVFSGDESDADRYRIYWSCVFVSQKVQ